MQILPSSPVSAYIKAVELDGVPVNATFIDMDTGRIQYWNAGSQVEGVGTVRLLLESKKEVASLDPKMSNELDRLLEMAKQRMAIMPPEERVKAYEQQRLAFGVFEPKQFE